MYHERLWQSCVVPHSEYGMYIVCKCAVNIYISGITYYVKLWAFYVCLSYPVFCITYYIFCVTVKCKVCPSWHSPVCDWMTHYFLCIYCIVFVYIVMKWHITFYVYILHILLNVLHICVIAKCAPRGTVLYVRNDPRLSFPLLCPTHSSSTSSSSLQTFLWLRCSSHSYCKFHKQSTQHHQKCSGFWSLAFTDLHWNPLICTTFHRSALDFTTFVHSALLRVHWLSLICIG